MPLRAPKLAACLASCATLMLATAATHAEKTGTLSGRVQEVDTSIPLSEAYVLVGGTPLYETTDADGLFLFRHLRPGVYRVIVSHIGYEALEHEVEVRSETTADLLFQLVRRPGRFDPVVITGSRAPNTLSKSSLSAHVLENVDRPAGLQTAADLLRSVSGVDLSGGAAPGLVAGVSLRGASPGQTLVMLDGVRLNMAGQTSTLGGVDLSEIGVDHVDRIEVVKGPGSALYGGDAGGGVIQIFTRGVQAKRSTRVSLTTGAGQRVDDDGGLFATQRYTCSTVAVNMHGSGQPKDR